MIEEHLPALQIVVPLIAAPLCIVLRKGDHAWAFATTIAWAAFAMSTLLLDRVLAEGTLVYEMGGWAAPWGIEYRIDRLNAFVLTIVAGIAAVALPYARNSVANEIDEAQQPLFYSALLLCMTGLLGVTITGDAFNLFVFLEISSLSSYALISMGARQDRRALTAAYNYLIMGTIGATFYVIGVGLLYMVTGTLNMGDLSLRLGALFDNRTVLVAFVFLFTGLGLKIAMFPLHFWLPNAYAYAPSAVTVFLASTATKVAVYAMLRVMFTVFGAFYVFEKVNLSLFLLPLALVAMFVASLVAIYQKNLKRMLAYSSVAQIGYMLLGVGLANTTSLTATIVHLFNHALVKGGLFMALGAIMLRLGSVHIDSLNGIAKRMPWTMAAFVAGGLSLIGVPLTVGFISKWYLISAALEAGMWPVAVAVLATSLLAVIYIWRVVEAAYFREPSGESSVREAPLSLLVPTWLLVAGSIYFGINTEMTVGVAGAAARVLLGGVS